MEITVVGLKGLDIPKFSTPDDMVAAAPSYGLTHTGYETQTHLRAHLIGLPKFKELHGPMDNGSKDGVLKVRYETWEASELYSS
ncbi:hypothetical protein [Agrobacterium tumefaciens]|uniref:hypothetical protein n=1 Tax=Agrobacterium tumefaciens TaxID=358 RepID=UPI001572F12B|nr:hypothetical protein [Agrobacterium tumefaciens]